MTSILGRLHAARAGLATFLSALAGSAVGPALLLAAVASAGTFVALDSAQRTDAIETSALRQTLTTSPRLDQSITSQQDLAQVEQSVSGYPLQALGPTTLGQIKQSLNRSLAGQGVPVGAPSGNWIGLSADAGLLPVPGSRMPDVTWLVWRDTLAPLHLTSGRLPQAYTAAGADTPATFEVVLSQETAAAVHAHVGSVLEIGEGSAGDVALTVTGIFEAEDAASAYWTYDPGAATPYLDTDGPVPGATYENAMMFVAPQAAKALEVAQADANVSFQTATSLDMSKITAAQAPSLLSTLQNVQLQSVEVGPIEGTGQMQSLLLRLTVGPIDALTDFVDEQSEIGTLLSLVTTSLEVLGVILLLLCIRLVVERRAGELAMMRARGASKRALAAEAGRAGLISVPCVVVVTLLAGSESWLPATFLALLALAGPAVLAVRVHGRIPRAHGVGHQERRAGRVRQARRIALTVAVISVCVGAVFALRYDASQASNNALVGAAPLLLAVPIALVLLHVAPVVIRALAKLAAFARGAVAFVGLARAARSSSAALLPSAALILAFSVIALGSTIRASITQAEVDASWQSIGADARVTTDGLVTTIPADVVKKAEALPGVTRGVSAYSTEVAGIDAYSGQFTVLVVDPAAYQAFTGTPLALPEHASSASAATPVVLSSTLAESIGAKTVAMHLLGSDLKLKAAGTVETTAALPSDESFMIVPEWAFKTAPPTSIVMLDGSIDSARLTAAFQHVQAAQITLRATMLHALTDAPMQSGVFELFDLGIAVALACCVAALAVSLSLQGPARAASLSRLATMGLSRSRLDLLVLTEQLPPILVSLLGGGLGAIAISALIGPTLDLTVFTGTPAPAPRVIDLGAFAEASAAIAAAAALALLGHAALTRRRGLAAALRVGDR
ncbi:hypothetical protein KDL01_15500 [Actinospica durhamensis]|uniref:FtsX-like permease family protein n=1 Tax=Actinospica durhamensis TaxID=1508375 RepID=A0A941EVG7_9ACTN|nr:hypothetical protein [Actinospica durhamensis]MBR7834679.1 hypothetical protein [Actinospica durhamensis]